MMKKVLFEMFYKFLIRPRLKPHRLLAYGYRAKILQLNFFDKMKSRFGIRCRLFLISRSFRKTRRYQLFDQIPVWNRLFTAIIKLKISY